MVTAAKPGIGTTLKVANTGSPITYTSIGEVKNVNGPNVSNEQIEVTNLDSPNNFKEFIGGLKDGGEIQFEMNWIKGAKQTQIRDDVVSATKRTYQISWPTSPATTATFSAFPTNFSMSAEPNAAITASVTLKLTADITWA